MKSESTLKAQSFIQNHVEYTEFQQSPADFHIWTAISMIAAALERNVYYYAGYSKIFPNLWTVFVAASALASKSTAADMGIKNIFQRAFTRDERHVEIGMTTPASFYQRMSERAKEHGRSAAYIYADEMNAMFSRKITDSDFLEMLTRTYNCPSQDDGNKTKNCGTDEFVNICWNMLATITAKDILDNVTNAAFKSGFMGRFTFIYATQPGKRVAHPEDHMTPERNEMYEAVLIDQLRAISRKAGQYTYADDAAHDFYEHWYNTTVPLLAEKGELHRIDEVGVVGRIGTLARKLSMVIAASEDPYGRELTLSLRHVEHGIALAESSFEYACSLFDRYDQSRWKKMMGRLEKMIGERGKDGIELSVITSSMRKEVNATELKHMLITLRDSRLIEKVNERVYWIPAKEAAG